MKTFGRSLFCITIILLSGLGLLGLLPFAKEGMSQDLVPTLLGGAAAFLVLGALWWRVVSRSLVKAIPVWIVLAVPCLAYLAAAGALLWAQYKGTRLAAAASIENYSEEPILWPGFEGPVGWRISFDLRHPEGAAGLIVPPEIRMGPTLEIPRDVLSASRTGGSGTFKSSFLPQNSEPLALLKTVLFQRLYENPDAKQPYAAWTSARRFGGGDRTQLVYNLHPGVLDFLATPARFCLAAWAPGIEDCPAGARAEDGCRLRGRAVTPVGHRGSELSALWAAFGTNDMVADFSPLLTQTLRRESRLQNDPAAWQAIQKRLTPENLLARGFALCPAGENSHNSHRVCFCR